MSQLKEQLESAALQKRQSELEAWATELETKEKLINDSAESAEYKILQEKIKLGNTAYANLEDSIIQLTQDLEELNDEYAQRKLEIERESLPRQDAIKGLDLKVSALQVEITDLGLAKTKIEGEVSSVAQYLKDQEAVVEQTVQDWNTHLAGFKSRAAEADAEAADKVDVIARMEIKADHLREEINELEDKSTALESKYEETAARYKRTLIELQSDINVAKSELDQVMATVKVAEEGLKLREESIMGREITLRQGEQDLKDKTRKLKMDQGIAGRSWA